MKKGYNKTQKLAIQTIAEVYGFGTKRAERALANTERSLGYTLGENHGKHER